jgi:translation initiation factor IF-1
MRGARESSGADLTGEFLLGETVLNRGGTTNVPEKVVKALSLKPKSGERSKLLWTLDGDRVIVTKGTPQSDWRKTMLRKNGTAAIPRHIQQALNLKITSHSGARVLWIRKGDQIVVRTRTRT